jgi:AcrR family transcriptional regulator
MHRVQSGLRERKKRETHEALTTAARELVHAHGLDHVTVEDIADAAGVSVRTFFNYFGGGKDEALVGIQPAVVEELAAELRARPAHEYPAAALRAVLFETLDRDGLRRWQLRNELVARYPSLLPRHLEATARVETALAAAVAERLGVDPAEDPTAHVVVASVLAAIRAAVTWWHDAPRTTPLSDALDQALSPFDTH